MMFSFRLRTISQLSCCRLKLKTREASGSEGRNREASLALDSFINDIMAFSASFTMRVGWGGSKVSKVV
jgi:hypothetical protein